jgi:hypothetical protein
VHWVVCQITSMHEPHTEGMQDCKPIAIVGVSSLFVSTFDRLRSKVKFLVDGLMPDCQNSRSNIVINVSSY